MIKKKIIQLTQLSVHKLKCNKKDIDELLKRGQIFESCCEGWRDKVSLRHGNDTHTVYQTCSQQ